MTAPATGVLLVSLAVLFLPGAAVAAAAGLRRSLVLATAPLLGYGLATATGTVAGAVHLTWGPWLLAAEAAALSAVLLLVRSRGRGPSPSGRRWRPHGLARRDLAVTVGIAVGGLLSTTVLLAGFGGLGRPSQDWDYSFHANATRFIADTGEVAPSALRAVNDWGSSSFFYPNAFHALAAVVRDLTGTSVFSAVNSSSVLVGAIAGLGLAVLLRESGAPTPVTALTPVLLAGFASFPYDMLWRGPVLPYAMGIALTPAFLLLVRALLEERRVLLLVPLALGGAALLGLQPSTALSAGLLTALMTAQRWLTRRRVPLAEVGLLLGGVALVALVAVPEVLGSLRTGISGAVQDWPAEFSALEALRRVVMLDEDDRGAQLVLALLALTGLLTLRSARYLWWLVSGTAIALGLYVLAASSDGPLAEALTRPWWNDRWRFLALAVLGLAPLAAHGLTQGLRGIAAIAARLSRRTPPVRARVGRPLALALGVAVLASALYAGENGRRLSTAYQDDHHLDAAEVTAMAWLAARVGPGEPVMNDPGDGSVYMSALQGLRPVFGHQVPLAAYEALEPARKTLLDRFNCLDSDPGVRAAIAELGVRYVFLGSGYVFPGMHRVTGLVGLSVSPSLTQVYAEGGVQIYEVRLAPRSGDPIPGCRSAREHAPS